MSGILVVAECADGQLGELTAQLVMAAVALGGRVTLGFVAGDVGQVAAQCAISGVDEIVAVRVDSEAFDHEVQSAAIRAMIEQVHPKVVLMGYTIRTTSFAAGLAESLDLGFASDVVGLSRGLAGELVAVRPMYGGKIHAELAFSGESSALVLLRPNVLQTAAPGGAPHVRELSFDPSGISRVRHREYRRPAEGVDLRCADVIFSVGRGVGEQKNIQPFAEIAQRMGAALGASRPVVDAGWLPAPHQVGQTGITVKPKLYVAFGISGAMQHLVGMQSSTTIVAVNTDSDAPIFDVADVGAVADIHEVAEQIKALLGDGGTLA